jgi:cell division septation protein DedD
MSLLDQEAAADPLLADDVAPGERETTWRDAFLASLRPSDRHVSDDEIFEILKAGSEGEAAAQLFAAKSVTLPMYCVWKAKYRHLDLEQLREVRRMELWRTRAVLAVFLTVTVLGTGAIVVSLARAVQANFTRVVEARSPGTLRPTTPSTESTQVSRTQQEPAPPPTPAPEVRLIRQASRADALPATAERGGYKIQVAARPSLQEARELLQQLTSAGYLAYLLQANVGNTDVVRVRVGPFDTLAAAQKTAYRLRRDGYNDAWIAP